MANLSNYIWERYQRLIKSLKVMAVILTVAAIYQPGEATSQTIPGTYNVNLVWNAHPDPTVIGYRINYGTTSGTYTGIITVGKVTSMVVPGLASDVKYFFALTAHREGGENSEFSNQVSFLPGLETTTISFTENGQMVLTVKGRIGKNYGIQASENLKDWSVIDTVTITDGGAAIEFSDPDQDEFTKRFYRTPLDP